MSEQRNLQIPGKGFTHAGKFHSDDVFSTALLRILNPKIEIERGFEVPEDFDGIIYDIGRGRFDHHQEDKEIRQNGVSYAAFGLLWREFGKEILGEEEALRFDERFIQPLDESDNTGCDNLLAEIITQFNPGWDSDASYDACFWKAVEFAKQILENHFASVQGIARAKEVVCRAMEKSNGKILVLPCYAPWKSVVIGSSYQVVVYPSNRGGYSIQGVPVSREDSTLLCEMPREWWGKTPEELACISGIAGFRFCHPTGFLASAETKDDALRIAEYACKAGN